MALQFNVSQLLKSGIGEIREYDFQAEEPIDLEDGVASNVRGHVKFTLTNFGITSLPPPRSRAPFATGRLTVACTL